MTKALFEPFTLKSLELKNRIAMAPMTRSMSPNGNPGRDVAANYRASRRRHGPHHHRRDDHQSTRSFEQCQYRHFQKTVTQFQSL